MGTDNTYSEILPRNLKNSEDFLQVYKKRIVEVNTTEEGARSTARSKLQTVTSNYLSTVEPHRKFSLEKSVDVIAENVESSDWSAVDAHKVCCDLEEFVLQLGDQPWRVDFHKIKRYGGFWRTHVGLHLRGVETLLATVGFQADPSQDCLVLKSPPASSLVYKLAAELHLLSMEFLLYSQILTLVKPSGFDIRHVFRCRLNIAGNVKECVKWIREQCTSKSHLKHQQITNNSPPRTTLDVSEDGRLVDGTEYAEIGSPAVDCEDEGKTFDLGSSPQEASAAKREPIYSQVNKTKHSDSGYISANPSRELKMSEKRPTAVENEAEKSSLEVIVKGDIIDDIHPYGFDSPPLKPQGAGEPFKPTSGERHKPTGERFRPATSDEHHQKSFIYLNTRQETLGMPVSPSSFTASPACQDEWEYVRQGLRHQGNQPSEHEDILHNSQAQKLSTHQTPSFHDNSRQNVSFSTFRPPNYDQDISPTRLDPGYQTEAHIRQLESTGLNMQVHPSFARAPQATAKRVPLPTIPNVGSTQAPSTDWTTLTASAIQSNMDRVANYRSASFYENLPHQQIERQTPTHKPISYPPGSKQDLVKQKLATEKPFTSPTLPKSQPYSKDKLGPTQAALGNHWQCHTCSAYNIQGMEVCDHCGQSHVRVSSPQEEETSQCPRCTLINPAGARVCSMCSLALVNTLPTFTG